MNWFKKAKIMEEYWIDEYGQAYFADGDIGDMNHELYVIKKIIEDKLDIDYEDYDFYDIMNMNTEELINKGFDNEEIMILKNKKDPREYAIKKWGWIRGIGNNLQIWKIDDRVIRNIANGIYEVFGEDIFEKELNIEILGNNTVINNIPFEIINRESIKELWFHMNSQNKFAQSNTPISIYSYSKTYGELKILFNNKGPYTYYNVSPYTYNKIRYLLNKKNYSYVNKILRNISKNTPHTEEEKSEMLDELYERGYLK